MPISSFLSRTSTCSITPSALLRPHPLQTMARHLSLLTPTDLVTGPLERFKLLDASFHLPNSGRSATAEYLSGPRIPGARLFDHDAIADTSYTIDGTLKLGHMQPDRATFKRAMDALGIARDDHLVVYDSAGVFSSPRAAWLLNSYGHPQISVLDGGLPRWISEGHPTEAGAPASEPAASDYALGDWEEAAARAQVASYEEVVRNAAAPAAGRLALLDARPRGRFLGTDPEPRPGLSSGHIPHSLSLPFTALLSEPSASAPSYRTFLPPAELEKVFVATIGDKDTWAEIKRGKRGLVASCGSGMTACVIWLAIKICGGATDKVRLYDESWTGYGLRKGSKIEMSLA